MSKANQLNITTKTDRLPHAYREIELEEMEKSGVIEPSQSELSAPIVIIKKKDGFKSAYLCRLSKAKFGDSLSDAWVKRDSPGILASPQE